MLHKLNCSDPSAVTASRNRNVQTAGLVHDSPGVLDIRHRYGTRSVGSFRRPGLAAK